MSVQIAIVCTTCGCTGVADREPAHSLRAKLKGRGWAVGCYSMKDRSSTGAYDFCPPCIQNYVRVEKAQRSVSGADAVCTEAVAELATVEALALAGVCPVCRHPKNSGPCQRQHP